MTAAGKPGNFNIAFFAVDLLQETITFAINICIFRLNIVAFSKIQLLVGLQEARESTLIYKLFVSCSFWPRCFEPALKFSLRYVNMFTTF